MAWPRCGAMPARSRQGRALSRAPDQPGIVADVARLLSRMGRSGEGEQICKVFLLPRQISEPVKQALSELYAVGSRALWRAR